jgi:uroporphyrinogen decarboxylase
MSTHLGPIGKLGYDVVSLDWRIPLPEARRQLPHVALQGNLDSTLLLGPKETLLVRARQVLEAVGHEPGYIFNLGHGIQPPTAPENVKALVDEVHAFRP